MTKGLFVLVLVFASTAALAAKGHDSSWLHAKLYGSDNRIAALRYVRIFNQGEGYRIFIKNQFGFECDLTLDARGRPAILSGCKSTQKPEPICTDIHNPNTMCASGSGCFQSLPEKNPRCYYNWAVRESSIKLNCSSTKTEDICRGKYTLMSNGDGDPAVMTIAKRRK